MELKHKLILHRMKLRFSDSIFQLIVLEEEMKLPG